MKKRMRHFLLPCLGLTLVGLTACVDDNYDLSNMDMTMQFGSDNGLTLPASSTGDIELKSVLETSDVVKLINDKYYLVKSGTADIKDFEIAKVSIAKPNVQSFTKDFDLNTTAPTSAYKAPRRNDLVSTTWSTIKAYLNANWSTYEALNYEYPITADKAKSTFATQESGVINDDVVSIKSVGLVDNSLKVVLTIENHAQFKMVKQVHIQDLTIAMPAGLVYTAGKFQGNAIDAATLKTASETGKLVLSGSHDVKLSEGISLELTFAGAKTQDVLPASSVVFDAASHKARIMGQDITIEGKVIVLGTDFDKDYLLATDAAGHPANFDLTDLQKVYNTGSLKSLLPGHITLKGAPSFASDMVVRTFTGAAQHKIDEIKPINLTNIPDFLQNKDVKLDLKNPQLYLKVTNSIAAGAELKTLTFTSKKASDSKYTPVTISNTQPFVFAAAGTTNYQLAKTAVTTDIPGRYENPTCMEGVAIGSLIQKIPETIEVAIPENIQLPDCQEVALLDDAGQPKKYQVGLEYELYSPIEFGPDFHIVYTDTINEMHKDLKDVDKYDFKGLTITASVVSDVPMDLTLTMTPIDEIKKSLAYIAVINSVNVKAGIVEANKKITPVTTPVTLTMTPAQDHTMQEILKVLDGFILKAEAKGQDGGTLRGDQKLKLNGIKIKLNGAITADFN